MLLDGFKYLIMALYVGATYWLAVLGMRKADSLRGFSISKGDLGPVLVGITMAASIASTATFVINPGFVYTHGLSAYIHYGVAGFLGIATALIVLCKKFRGIGDAHSALTIPHWIYGRYGSRPLSLFFAIINLLSITFVVLILVGCAILCAGLFGISQKLALVLVLLFVFSYVLLGGAYAHAYTNALQGVLMVIIALFLFALGFARMEGGFWEGIRGVSAAYAAPFNPESPLYYDFFSVFLSGFIITFALMMQPHILTKCLFLKSDREVNRFLVTALVSGFVFTLMLFIGFFARLKGLDIDRQDQVVAVYIAHEFGAGVGGKMVLAVISVALLAAGMSTLDGILVALSTMVVNDIYLPLRKQPDAERRGLVLSRYVLAAVGLGAFALAWNPPRLVGLFAQKGVYGIAAASMVPITLGVLVPGRIPTWIVSVGALVGVVGHFAGQLVFGIANPSVSASYAILASLGLTLLLLAFSRYTSRPSPTAPSPYSS